MRLVVSLLSKRQLNVNIGTLLLHSSGLMYELSLSPKLNDEPFLVLVHVPCSFLPHHPSPCWLIFHLSSPSASSYAAASASLFYSCCFCFCFCISIFCNLILSFTVYMFHCRRLQSTSSSFNHKLPSVILFSFGCTLLCVCSVGTSTVTIMLISAIPTIN